ncbi:hypothetical protein [Burkholderia cepacia]|uniref:Uncharacterized protein n=1 Tax=Burkholderia cepacia GG4 TaxID=1009846 RepID=A0A9W3JXD6_BURCE|nr:hypothetical protein [Burkholderia cepacia]AFQ47018.1 hypothetical protein GEM_0567 [Burkholderia cepacia GG4]
MTYADGQSAFEGGEFQRPERLPTLKLALAHCNFLEAKEKAGCPTHAQIDQAIQANANWPNWSLNLPEALLFQGEKEEEEQEVWFVRRARDLFHETEVEELFVEEKVAEFIQRDATRTLWVTDGMRDDGEQLVTSDCDIGDLYQSLGLYNRTLSAGDKVVIAYLNSRERYRPTVADAGGAFYWRDGHEGATHGLTVHLTTGRPALREWVSRADKLNVLPERSLMRNVEREVNTTDAGLHDDYWQAGVQRITQCRGQHDH